MAPFSLGGLFGGAKTYKNPQNTYWTLDDLRTAISSRVGLEAKLDSFVIEGKVKIQDKEEVSYTIEHIKKSMLGWVMHITADASEAQKYVYGAVKDVVGGRDLPLAGIVYLSPQGNPSTSEIVAAVVKYSGALGEVRVSKIKFLDVPKDVYKKATDAKLKLEETKS